MSVRRGGHLHAAFQEHILERGVQHDLTIANLEVAYVAVAMHLALSPQLTSEIQDGCGRRATSSSQQPQQRHFAMTHASDEAIAVATSRERTVPASSWTAMADLDLEETLRQPAVTVRECPRQAFGLALRSRSQRNEAAWKLFVLIPRMLLQPTQARGDAGKSMFFERMRRFQNGEWASLLADAVVDESTRKPKALDAEAALTALRDEAERKAKMRELSKARTLLSSSGLAPCNDDTLAQLTDPNLRLTELSTPIPPEAVLHRPFQKIELDRRGLLEALRRAGRGSAQDLTGMRYEHLRVLIEDDSLWAMFGDLAEDFARAEVPTAVMQALRLGRMTALNKKDNKVRGIVAGSVLRRLVCKTVAAQYSDDFMTRTAPFQFALQTKAGTDALAHAIRFLTDHDEHAVVVSLDGIGAFDHLRRAAFFNKLLACEELKPLLPLVTARCGTTSRFSMASRERRPNHHRTGRRRRAGMPIDARALRPRSARRACRGFRRDAPR